MTTEEKMSWSLNSSKHSRKKYTENTEENVHVGHWKILVKQQAKPFPTPPL